MSKKSIPRAWNPKRLGKKASHNGPGLATDVWCYLVGGKLEVVIEVTYRGTVLGQTTYDVRLPI